MVVPIGSRTVTASVFAKASELDVEHLKQRLPSVKKYLIQAVANDCRNFAEIMKDWRDNNLWRHFSDSWEAFIVDHLEKPPEWVDHMILGWEMLDPSTPIKADVAVEVGRNRAIELAENPGTVKPKNSPKINPAKVVELREQGMTQQQIADELGGTKSGVSRSLSKLIPFYHGKMESTSTKPLVILDTSGTNGNHSEYLAARLARDSPETLEQVKAGDFSSIRAAAVSAGIIKPRKQFAVTPTTDPVKLAQRILDYDQALALALAHAIIDSTGTKP